MHHLSWAEASVVGLLQGASELFPVSSLGHSVLIPALVGGSWARDLNVHDPESPYLAFIVGLHVATAIALVVFFRRDWLRIVRGLGTSVRDREVVTSEQRLAWLLILATIPVGVSGLLLEHTLRTVLAKPVLTSLFLAVNGVILLAAERLIRRPTARTDRRDTTVAPAAADRPRRPEPVPGAGTGTGADTAAAYHDRVTTAVPTSPSKEPSDEAADEPTDGWASDERLARLPVGRAVLIGAAQIAALAPGI
ncbi:MAG: undecaprenyl-diphosphate phosphatase, partial [Frankia sp.]